MTSYNINQSKTREGKYAYHNESQRSMKHETWKESHIYFIWRLYFIIEELKSGRDNMALQRTQRELVEEPRLEPPKY